MVQGICIMRPKLTEVIEWAYQAGEILRASFGKDIQIQNKGIVDLVTEMDHRSEDFIIGQIKDKYASHTIITEESGHLNGDADRCWYVDPLDGTLNYAHRVPIYTVSIAYAENGRIEMGVVYDPMQNECYSAERGMGAWLNEDPIQVSNTPALIDSLLVTGFPYDKIETPENNFDNFIQLMLTTQGVRRLGSAALDLCYVAAGRLDGYWELKMYPWDIAAGTLIVEEAGGVVTGLDGGEDFMSTPYSLVASNPALHPQILQELHKVRQRRLERTSS